MAFNLFGKRKKYPFNKKMDDPPKAVYAGPEYFARRSGRAQEDDVLDVYAGPEYYEREPDPKEAREAPLPPEDPPTAVYAGPEPPEERGALIYAGPEFFERRNVKAPDASAAVGVYAGPDPGTAVTMGMGTMAMGMGTMAMGMGTMRPEAPVPAEPEETADEEA
jgi:hypothetical protein